MSAAWKCDRCGAFNDLVRAQCACGNTRREQALRAVVTDETGEIISPELYNFSGKSPGLTKEKNMIKGSNEHLDQIEARISALEHHNLVAGQASVEDNRLSTLTEIVAAHSEKLSSFSAVPNLENRLEVLERKLAGMDKALDVPAVDTAALS
jgi:hypothetical protein